MCKISQKAEYEAGDFSGLVSHSLYLSFVLKGYAENSSAFCSGVITSTLQEWSRWKEMNRADLTASEEMSANCIHRQKLSPVGDVITQSGVSVWDPPQRSTIIHSVLFYVS